MNDILQTVEETPDIITISETKLTDSSLENISVPGYIFINKNSKTNAGGVGLYIKDTLNFIRRTELDLITDGLETYFIELPRRKQKNIIVGCGYRHQHNDRENVNEILRNKLEYISCHGFETYILGDINIDFFEYNNDKATSEYLDMLFDHGFTPIITKPTRHHSATLIGHIYSNSIQKVIKSGICLADISDHLPCFCTIATKLYYPTEEKYYRDFYPVLIKTSSKRIYLR